MVYGPSIAAIVLPIIIVVLVIALKHTAKELEEVSAELEPVIAGHTDTPTFRIICLAAAAWGLVVPAVGSNPVSVTILAQISNVFVLPLTVAVILWLVNRKDVMGRYRAGPLLNTSLAAAFAVCDGFWYNFVRSR